ncbi:MAG TPA: glycosyltransferase [Pyrinomonadaceae bacterium]|nr:glycosyltransferase [Pyrinomonadaceae bacterium]
MRVLCVAAAYPPYGKGGGPKGSENIAKALYARGHTVRVITVADDEKFEVRDGIEVKTVRSLNVYWNYWVTRPAIAKLLWHALENFNPRALLRMRREIAAFRPDIVVTISIENINVATWVAAWTLRCPSVHVIQSLFLMCWRGTMFSKNKNCERPCLRCRVSSIGKKLCSRIVDGVTAEASHSISLHYEHGFFRRAVAKVIPGAVARPRSAPSSDVTRTGPLRVGYIGMLTPNKGISTLGAAAELLGDDAPFEYLIAGDGTPEFVQQVLSKFPTSRTSYLGWVNSNSYYPSIDVLVVPSLSAEAFGYVCIEALSFGVPAIVARSGALPEIIEDEKSGLIFEAGDHEALAACLRRIASDRFLLKRLRHGALARAGQYSPEAFAESFDTFVNLVRANAKGKWRSRRHAHIEAARSPIP